VVIITHRHLKKWRTVCFEEQKLYFRKGENEVKELLLQDLTRLLTEQILEKGREAAQQKAEFLIQENKTHLKNNLS
jgi:hypothetical protein